MLRVHPCGCGHAAGHADPDVSCLSIQALTVEHFISSDEAMVRGSSIALILLFTVVSPATGETVNFESSAAIRCSMVGIYRSMLIRLRHIALNIVFIGASRL